MTNVRWWRIGVVRMIGLLVLIVGLDGLATNIYTHQWWSLNSLSMLASACLILIAIALLILGYRTARDYEETNELAGTGRPNRHSTRN